LAACKTERSTHAARRCLVGAAKVVLLLLLLPRTGLAYIDPVSGSIVLQVLAAGLFAASLAFRRLRLRIASVLRDVFSWFRG
jgi:hypothetical protein